MAIEIQITADIDNAIRAFQRGEISLEDLGDKLQQTADDGKDVGREIQKGAEVAGDGLDKMADKSSNAGDGFRGLGGAAKDALEGDIGGAVSGAVEAVSGMAAIIPGIGGLVGAGLGTALSEGIKLFSANVDAEAAASEDRIKTMYENFIESQVNYLTESQKNEAIGAILGDDAKYKEAQDRAAALGVTIQEVLAAEIEGGDARNALLDKANELRRAALDVGLKGEEIDSNAIVTLTNINDHYRTLNDEQGQATQKAELYRSTVELTTGAAARNTEEIQKSNKLLAETPKTVPVSLVPDTSALDAAVQPRTVRVNLVDQYGRGVK